MIELGPINSRLKDFYDIWLLSRQFTFEGPLLADAISRTFEKRGTQVDPSPVALSVGFLTDNMRQRQWAGFLKRSALGDAPAALHALRGPLRTFLLPVGSAIAERQAFDQRWSPADGWAPA